MESHKRVFSSELMLGKSGSVRTCSDIFSVAGKIPALKPNLDM